MRVPTASGVLIAEEISGEVCAAANRSIASRVKVATEVASAGDFMSQSYRHMHSANAHDRTLDRSQEAEDGQHPTRPVIDDKGDFDPRAVLPSADTATLAQPSLTCVKIPYGSHTERFRAQLRDGAGAGGKGLFWVITGLYGMAALRGFTG